MAASDYILFKYSDKFNDGDMLDPQDQPFSISNMIDFSNHPHESTTVVATTIGLLGQIAGGIEGHALEFTLIAAADLVALATIAGVAERPRDSVFESVIERVIKCYPTAIAGAIEMSGIAGYCIYKMLNGEAISGVEVAMLGCYAASSAFYMKSQKRLLLEPFIDPLDDNRFD